MNYQPTKMTITIEPDLDIAPFNFMNEDRFYVILYNDNFHSFQQVIFILVTATGCSLKEAYNYANTAHENGEATVYWASEKECKKVSDIISSIGLKTNVFCG